MKLDTQVVFLHELTFSNDVLLTSTYEAKEKKRMPEANMT